MCQIASKAGVENKNSSMSCISASLASTLDFICLDKNILCDLTCSVTFASTYVSVNVIAGKVWYISSITEGDGGIFGQL